MPAGHPATLPCTGPVGDLGSPAARAPQPLPLSAWDRFAPERDPFRGFFRMRCLCAGV